MKNGLIKRGIVLSIILVLVGTCLIPNICADENETANMKHNKILNWVSLANLDNEELLAYWSFDESDGNIAHDFSGNNNHGTISGADWTNGVSGDALDFAEDENIVQYIQPTFDDTISDEFTIEGWVYWSGDSSPDGGPYIFDAAQVSPPKGFLLQLNDTDGSISLRYGTGTGWEKINGNDPVTVDAWTYIAVVYNLSDHTLTSFLNGMEDNTVAINLPYSNTEITAAIGNNRWAPFDGNWRSFFGIIDELRIYNKALTENEILFHYQQPTVEITSPESGTKVKGFVTINGTANDIDGTIDNVQIQINEGEWENASIGKTTSTVHWNFYWDTSSVGDGSNTISARSIDDDGYTSEEDSNIVNVNNLGEAPEVTITSPESGKWVNGNILIEGEAHDPDGQVVKVELSFDYGTTWKIASGTNSWNYSWDTNEVNEGAHVIYAKATDNIGYVSTLADLILNIDNTPPEEPIIEFPEKNHVYILRGWITNMRPWPRLLKGKIIVIGGFGFGRPMSIFANDSLSGISHVEFWRDNAYIKNNDSKFGIDRYRFYWQEQPPYVKGDFDIKFVAKDLAGNSRDISMPVILYTKIL